MHLHGKGIWASDPGVDIRAEIEKVDDFKLIERMCPMA